MASPPPLTNLRVIELAGLAPGPFAGQLLGDYGASVLRIDRPRAAAYSSTLSGSADVLARRKESIAVNIKSEGGRGLLSRLCEHADVLIDPYRPGVLEAACLAPADLLKANPRLIIARLTGFRPDSPYANMAGHDINYLAVSGVLALLGPAGRAPLPPGNLVADFGGGGSAAVLGVLLALIHRERTGRGQIVQANMVDGSGYLATMPRLAQKTPIWNMPRGENLLDGGCPWYRCYETKDGQYMAVGALEQRFFDALVRGLDLPDKDLPNARSDSSTWPALAALFASRFRERTRAQWESVFIGTDACCTPVLTYAELELGGFEQRPMAGLQTSPARAISRGVSGDSSTSGQGPGVEGDGWHPVILSPGPGGERLLQDWTGGWRPDVHYTTVDGALQITDHGRLENSDRKIKSLL